MSKERSLQIVRVLRADAALREKCHELLLADRTGDILSALKSADVEADAQDWKEALDAYWIVDNLLADAFPPTAPSVSHADGRGAGTDNIEKGKAAKGEPREEFDLGLALQKNLVNVVERIDRGYNWVMIMHIIAFGLGIVLVLTSVVSSLAFRADMSSVILGGLGILDVVALLMFRPIEKIQSSRGNLAQLQAAFINWINDVYNWNRYLMLMGDAAARNRQSPSFEEVKQVSDALLTNTQRMMSLIELHCQISSGELSDNLAQRQRRRQESEANASVAPGDNAQSQEEPQKTGAWPNGHRQP